MVNKLLSASNHSNNKKRFAVLIDADNIPASSIEQIITEVTRLGYAQIKRVYGDWQAEYLTGWREVNETFGLKPIQQSPYTTGKNATDMAMTIDAMDIMHRSSVDGFCIVSSDSDFTPLTIRLREEGYPVFGFGCTQTPSAFTKACDQFIYLKKEARAQVSAAPAVPQITAAPNATVEQKQPQKRKHPEQEPLPLLTKVISQNSNAQGWANLSVIGKKMKTVDAEFSSKRYGYAKLSSLLKAHPERFKIRQQNPENAKSSLLVKLVSSK